VVKRDIRGAGSGWFGSVGSTLAIVVGCSAFPHAQTVSSVEPVGSSATVQGSLSGAYDSNRSSSNGVVNPLFQARSTHLNGDAQFQFAVPGRRVDVDGNVTSFFRMYQHGGVLANHAASLTASARPSPHLTLRGSGTTTYAPPYQINLYPSLNDPGINGQAVIQPVTTPFDTTLTPQQVLAYQVTGGLVYNPTKRTSFDLQYDFRQVDASNRAFGGTTQNAFAAYHIAVRRGLGIRLGYRYQTSAYTSTNSSTVPVRADNIDIGLDYGDGFGRGVRLSRKTTLTFGFGAATITNQGIRNVRLTGIGHALLSHQLSRTWSVSGGYGRGMNFVDGLGVPLFSDSASLRINGQLTRRVGVRASSGYAIGSVEDLSASGRYHSRRSDVGLWTAITAHLATFVQYSSYSHRFPETALLVQGAPAAASRQGIRVGLTFNLPFGSAKVPPF